MQSIDRIEVVRGPMSVIYGDNAFLGSINIVTNQAATTPNLGSISYGNNGARQAFLRLRPELDEGFMVFNGGYDAGDGVDGVDGRYADLIAPEQLATLDPRMHDDLGGNLDHGNYSLDISANYRAFTPDLQYSRMDYGAYFITPPFDDGNRVDLTGFHVALGYGREISNGVRLATRLIFSSEDYDADFDFIVPEIDDGQTQGSERLEFEVDLDWSANKRLDLIGGYRHRELFDIRSHGRLDTLGVVFNTASEDISQDDIFIQADYRPIDTLKLVAGLRLSHTDAYRVTEKDLLSGRVSQWHFPSRSAWTPRLGAIWSIDDRNLLKLLYGEALQDNSQKEVSEAEEIATWELNWLTRFEQGSLQLSLFENETDHLCRRPPDPGRAGRRPRGYPGLLDPFYRR